MSANKTKSEFLNGKYLNYFENSLPYPTYIVAFIAGDLVQTKTSDRTSLIS